MLDKEACVRYFRNYDIQSFVQDFHQEGSGGATTIAELSGFSWFYTGFFISREILQWLLTRGFGGILGEGWAILVENLRWPNFCNNPPVP